MRSSRAWRSVRVSSPTLSASLPRVALSSLFSSLFRWSGDVCGHGSLRHARVFGRGDTPAHCVARAVAPRQRPCLRALGCHRFWSWGGGHSSCHQVNGASFSTARARFTLPNQALRRSKCGTKRSVASRCGSVEILVSRGAERRSSWRSSGSIGETGPNTHSQCLSV